MDQLGPANMHWGGEGVAWEKCFCILVTEEKLC